MQVVVLLHHYCPAGSYGRSHTEYEEMGEEKMLLHDKVQVAGLGGGKEGLEVPAMRPLPYHPTPALSAPSHGYGPSGSRDVP